VAFEEWFSKENWVMKKLLTKQRLLIYITFITKP
jgi:hypothetical protein